MNDAAKRASALSSRHRALGSDLEDWNGMGTAWSYNTNPEDEYLAVRKNVGMFDMSPLRKIFISGSEALDVVDHLTTRDMSKIAPGQSAYVAVLSDAGTMADDAIVYRLSDDEWMLVHGTGDAWNFAKKSATGFSASIRFDDDLHDISVQGPRSLETLAPVCEDDISQLKYFEHFETKVFGRKARISRTGYTGERGYEIFALSDDTVAIWDGLSNAGVMPCSFNALDKLRIEAGLLFYGYDMTDQNTPWEVGLGFTINREKPNFRGRSAVFEREHSLGVKNVCLKIDSGGPLEGGELIKIGTEIVGKINSTCLLENTSTLLALAHVSPPFSASGTILTIEENGTSASASVVSSPIYDPSKSRTHSN